MKNMRIKGMMLFLMTALLFFPVKAEAVGILDTTKEVTLTISCKDGDRGIANAGFEIYQIGGGDYSERRVRRKAAEASRIKRQRMEGPDTRALSTDAR